MHDDNPAAAPPAAAAPHRTLLIIGGAEDKVGRSVVLRRFVKLAGGRRSRIVVIPTASAYSDEVAVAYTEVFTRLRGNEIDIVNPTSRRDGHDASFVARIDAATGVFMTGGNQVKLSQYVVGTPVGDAIARAHQRGAVIAGTSAGASIMSRFMISLGDEGLIPRQRTGQISAGLDLLPGAIIDQHFDERGRYGRLMAMVAASPGLLGIGIDENTAAEVRDERELTVIGSGAVFVVDARLAVTDAPEARRGAPLLVSGAVVHSLPAGSRFDLEAAALTEFVEQHPGLEGAVVPASVRTQSVLAASASASPGTGDGAGPVEQPAPTGPVDAPASS